MPGLIMSRLPNLALLGLAFFAAAAWGHDISPENARCVQNLDGPAAGPFGTNARERQVSPAGKRERSNGNRQRVQF